MKRSFSSYAASIVILAAGNLCTPLSASSSEERWQGYYLGIQTGSVWGDGNVAYTDNTGGIFRADGLKPDGLTSGIYGGYNRLLSDNWLIGIEGSYNGVSAHDLGPVSRQPIMRSKLDQNRDASLRLRIGRILGPTLPYLTGGAAWGRFDLKTCFLENCTDRQLTLTGWTAGAGIEMKLTPGLHARLQYRYTDYGGKTVPTGTLAIPIRRAKLDYDSHTLSLGFSYRPNDRDTASTAPSDDGWNGVYLGVQTGIARGDGSVRYTNGSGGTFQTDRLDPDGVMSGIYGGYTLRLTDDWIVGIEGEWNAAAAHASSLVTHAPLIRTKLDRTQEAALRLRIGKLLGRTLAYLTGGAAWSRYDLKTCYIQNCHTDHPNMKGWTLGAGVEIRLDSHWSARIQYRYTDYEAKTIRVNNPSSPPLDATVDDDTRLVTVGISYRF